MVSEVTPTEFVRRREAGNDAVLLDVREEWELQIANVPGTVHVPMKATASGFATVLLQPDTTNQGFIWYGADVRKL